MSPDVVSAHPSHAAPSGLNRARSLIGVALLLGILYAIGHSILLLADHRPVTILFSDAGALRGLGALVAATLAACVCAALASGGDFSRGMGAVAAAVALWAMLGGGMDDWLRNRNPVPGVASGGAYWALAPELAAWAAFFAAVAATLTRFGARRTSVAQPDDPKGSLGLSLLLTCAIGAGLTLLLMGPRLAWTLRGQVYFAVGVGFWGAAVIAFRTTRCANALGYWPAPFIVGALGLIWAALRPGLGGDYANINIIPAWGLARPLPVEMASVGILGALLGLRSATRRRPGE